jgi:hypothetical protein
MIAQQLQDIGINARPVAMDFGSIVNRINNRDFDMYILGWSIGSDPTDFLHAFFHSSAAQAGQNYPGYQNESFDAIIESARQTGDENIRKKAVADAQAAIVYDLPYDVLYYRTNIEAYRADRFTNWQVGSSGSIFNWGSIMNLRAPSKFKTNAQFVSPPSAVVSNSTDNDITIFVKDQDGNPLSGAHVILNVSMGSLSKLEANTSKTGKITVQFTAPYVNPYGVDGIPGTNENNTRTIPVIIKALLSSTSCLTVFFAKYSLSAFDLVIIIAVAVEIINAGIWATSPSPIVSNVYTWALSLVLKPC